MKTSGHQAMVEKIIADLRPVRRVWPVRLRLGLWIAFEVGVLLLLVNHGYRSDLTRQLRNPWYIFGVGGFATAGALAAAFALKMAIPGREPSKVEFFLWLFLIAASALLLLHQPVDEHLQLATFIHTGVPCAIGIGVFAVIPWVALVWAAKRAAPLSAAAEGAVTGAAALMFSFALMRVDCPVDDGLHLIVWHFIPAVVGILLSSYVGIKLLRRRISPMKAEK
jgi:hypothetical protein